MWNIIKNEQGKYVIGRGNTGANPRQMLRDVFAPGVTNEEEANRQAMEKMIGQVSMTGAITPASGGFAGRSAVRLAEDMENKREVLSGMAKAAAEAKDWFSYNKILGEIDKVSKYLGGLLK